MTKRELRMGPDGTVVIHRPELNKVLPWMVIWADPTQRSHWMTQQMSPQAVGTWSTLRPTGEHLEVLP